MVRVGHGLDRHEAVLGNEAVGKVKVAPVLQGPRAQVLPVLVGVVVVSRKSPYKELEAPAVPFLLVEKKEVRLAELEVLVRAPREVPGRNDSFF